MTDMSDKDLDMRLAAYEAPEPSELLKARILKAAKDIEPSQAVDAPKRSFAKRYMGLAASLVAVSVLGLTGLQMTLNSDMANPDAAQSELAALQEAATEFGFDEIYDWVESEDVAG